MGLVGVLEEEGDDDAAAELCAEVAADQLRVLGPVHPDTLRSEMNLASFAASDPGRLAEAAERTKSVAAAQAAVLGEAHPDALLSQYNLACLLAEQGETVAAERLCGEVAAAQASALGAEHPEVRRTKTNLAAIARQNRDTSTEAAEVAEMSLEEVKAELGQLYAAQERRVDGELAEECRHHQVGHHEANEKNRPLYRCAGETGEQPLDLP